MLRAIGAPLTMFAICMAAPAVGQISNSHMVGNWYLATVHYGALGNSCVAKTTLADGTHLELAMGDNGSYLKFELTNDDWVSLKDLPDVDSRGMRHIPISMIFNGTTETWAGTFEAIPKYTYNPVPLIRYGFEGDTTKEILAAFSGASSLSVTSNGHSIGQYPLVGSGAAVRDMVGCANANRDARNFHEKNDPFRK